MFQIQDGVEPGAQFRFEPLSYAGLENFDLVGYFARRCRIGLGGDSAFLRMAE